MQFLWSMRTNLMCHMSNSWSFPYNFITTSFHQIKTFFHLLFVSVYNWCRANMVNLLSWTPRKTKVWKKRHLQWKMYALQESRTSIARHRMHRNFQKLPIVRIYLSNVGWLYTTENSAVFPILPKSHYLLSIILDLISSWFFILIIKAKAIDFI